jgi:hypothetical protein
MARSLCILSLLLLTINVMAQDLSKTKTARGITIKSDTVSGRVLKQQQYKFRADTAYIRKQDTTLIKLDSIIQTKKKIK